LFYEMVWVLSQLTMTKFLVLRECKKIVLLKVISRFTWFQSSRATLKYNV